MSNQNNHSAQEKVDIVLEGLQGDKNISQLCKDEGISEPTYYHWRKKFLNGAKSGLRDRDYSKKKVIKRKIEDLERIIGRVAIESNLFEEPDTDVD